MTEEYTVIGKRGYRHAEGLPKATGKATFNRDIKLPQMLYGKMLIHPNAHSKIKSIDISKAEALPGVVSILKYDDAELQGIRPLFGQADAYSVQTDEYYFWGEECNIAVCAESEEICDEALSLIQIEWEELPFLLSAEEALKADAPLVIRNPNIKNEHPEMLPPWVNTTLEGNYLFALEFAWGDVEQGYQDADVIVEENLSYEYLEFAPAECDSVVVDIRDNDEVVFYIQEQSGVAIQQTFRSFFPQLPMSKCRIEKHYSGGTYGLRHNNFHPRPTLFALLFAQKTRKPIKILTDRKGDFYYHDGKIESCKLKIGVKNDGKITALSTDSLIGGGLGTTVGARFWSKDTIIPNFFLHEDQLAVSKAPVTAFRCELNNGAYHFSKVFDLAANAVGMDPTLIVNANTRNAPSLLECIKSGKEIIDWDSKWHSSGSKQLSNGKYHGLGFTWTEEWDGHHWSASGGVRICSDGSVLILGNITDFGVMPMTSVKIMCAETLGVRFEDVHFPPQQDTTCFLWEGMGGSCGLHTNSMVIKAAAEKAKKLLLERAVQPRQALYQVLPPAFPDLTPDDLDVKDSMVFEKSNPENKMSIPDILVWRENPCPAAWIGPLDIQVCVSQGETETNHEIHDASIPSTYYQAHFAEVEVDSETGFVEVTKIVNVNDIGQAIYPEGIETQQVGGTLMAWGRALTEEPVYDPMTGVLLNCNLLDYKYSTMRDCGTIIPKYLEVGEKGEHDGSGAYGNVGIGEDTATVVPAVILNAVNNALGTNINSLPVTPTKILKALGKI